MAIDPPIVDYATPATKSKRHLSWLHVVLFGVFVLAFLYAMLIPSGRRGRETAGVIKCKSNLFQRRDALETYAASHDGNFPNRLEELLLSTDIGLDAFVCPGSAETRAVDGATNQQTLANFDSQPGHCSYIYLGAGTTKSSPGWTVIAYEPLGHHAPKAAHKIDGSNELFADGNVVYVSARDFQKLIAELATTNPSPMYRKVYDGK